MQYSDQQQAYNVNGQPHPGVEQPRVNTTPQPQMTPPPGAPQQSQQQPLYQQEASVKIAPPDPTSYSFVPDEYTKELLSMVYPELANALINIAIKKMAETNDFHDYFIKQELKDKAEMMVAPKEEKQDQSQASASSTSGSSNNGVVDFSSW